MPFGLCNAPATFQRLMDVTLAGLNFEICLVYLDDIMVFSQNIESHLERLAALLERLSRANLKLKPSKCHFLRRSVQFLGYMLSKEGVQTDPKKIEAVVTWPVPKKLKDVRSFVGLCGYYRRLVDKFSEVAAPLHALTRKNASFQWTKECQSAFEKLKSCLVKAPILSLPKDEGQYILDTDASNVAIGAVLSQVQDDEERVIAYASRLYSNAERNYCVSRKELLAVVFFLKHFKQYLLGRQFLVRTDHCALQWLCKPPEPTGQQGRWLKILKEFPFSVVHQPGRKHLNTDALSRVPCKQCGMHDNESSVVQCRKTTTESMHREQNVDWIPETSHKLQAEDPELYYVYLAMKTNAAQAPSAKELEPQSKETKTYCAMWPFLGMHDSFSFQFQFQLLLFRRRPADVGRRSCL
jgi:hypothetical protein